MMTLTDKLCQIATDSGIKVFRFPMPESKSMSLPVGDVSAIGIDNSRRYAECEECVYLGHELGHCLYGGFYNRHTPYDIIGQHERRADAWFFQNFLPDAALRPLLEKGYSTEEMAEVLGVTEEYIKKALHYWTECRGVDFNCNEE